MSDNVNRLFGLAQGAKNALLREVHGLKRQRREPETHEHDQPLTRGPVDRFADHPGYRQITLQKEYADRLGIVSPYFRVHEGRAADTTRIGGREYLNFSTYDYLGLGGHPQIAAAAKAAIDLFGTSTGASRVVSGERPLHGELEHALADLYGTESCITLVSGHATNVTVLGHLFGPKDLIVYDALCHNSILQGALLSGATRRAFRHNDATALEQILQKAQGLYQRTLIVIEGLYSMDGDLPPWDDIIRLKRQYNTLLMVDEAHALGVLGERGYGSHELSQLEPGTVDIWMGTLSKTLASCGGYIAGSKALVEYLKFTAPGFLYSVGLSPPLAAAALTALRILNQEPNRVQDLAERSRSFLAQAQAVGLNTGRSAGYAIIPIMIGNSVKAAQYSNALFER
ncbi:MAG: aminotransferase class I/II-fold pyridoxal phosphate-dependent enzyme, partial [Candidatus Competibacteraceae bacterium]|nr:aminotransferase class I/II-fold pyridoxal phosphate-dependent enzyme [Candidatus Competibacteraceae bacterium]